MNYTKEQISVLAKAILKDLHGKYYNENLIEEPRFKKEDELMRGLHKGEKRPAWMIAIEEPVFKSIDFLTISDETGEPLYYQTKHILAEIVKGSDGKYTTL